MSPFQATAEDAVKSPNAIDTPTDVLSKDADVVEEDDDDMLSNIDVASPAKLNPITPSRTLPPRAARSKVDYSPRPKTPKTQSPKTKTPRSKSKKQLIAENRVLDSDMIVEETTTKTRATAPRVIKADTVRNRVREEIATTTKAKRDAFQILLAKFHTDSIFSMLKRKSCPGELPVVKK